MKLDNIFNLSDGCQLGYDRYGHDDGVPAFYFHGLPGSRREGIFLHQACVDAGVQLIAPDRPGFGLSQSRSGPRLQHWPELVSELADGLGFERFYLLAVSGGGPYALACASLLQARVLGTGICCGLGEIADAELRAGMRLNARLGFWLAQQNPAWLRYSYGTVITAAARCIPGLSIEILARFEGQPDCAVLRQPQIKAWYAASLHEAFHNGSAGAVADMCAALEPWCFDLTRVQSLQLWHGLQDRVVPVRHSEKLLERLPGARLHRVADEGHFSLPIRYAATVVRAVAGK